MNLVDTLVGVLRNAIPCNRDEEEGTVRKALGLFCSLLFGHTEATNASLARQEKRVILAC